MCAYFSQPYTKRLFLLFHKLGASRFSLSLLHSLLLSFSYSPRVLTLPAVSLDILSADHHNGIKAKQNATEIIKLMRGGNGAQYFRRTQTKWQN